MIDVESQLREAHMTSDGTAVVKARVRVDLAGVRPTEKPSAVPVAVFSRVYDKREVERRSSDSLVDCPVAAEGPEVALDATEQWSDVVVELPPMPLAPWVIVAKVTSRDPAWKVGASRCYAGLVTYGVEPVSISRAELEALKGDDPRRAREIQTLVEHGIIVVGAS